MRTTFDYSCLERFVGLQTVCEDVTEPLLVNDLPGIDLKTFAGAANAEDQTAKNLFVRLRRLAAQETARIFMKNLRSKYVINEYAFRDWIGDLDTTKRITEGSFVIKRTCAEVSLHLERVKIWVSAAGQIDLEINGQSTVLYVEQGYNTIDVDTLSQDEISVSITALGGVTLARQRGLCLGACGPCAYVNRSGPMVIEIACRCDNTVCAYAEDLAYAVRLKTASLLMQEVEYSTNRHSWIRNSRESAGRIRADIEGTKDPITDLKGAGTFYREINLAIQNAQYSGPCVQCAGTRYEEVIP